MPESFKKYLAGSPDDMSAFRALVMDLLKEMYPQADLKLSPNESGVILWREARVGLSNLMSGFNLSDRSEATLRKLVKGQLDPLLNGHFEQSLGQLSWGEAKPLLMAQLMPHRFINVAKPIVWQPFYDRVCMGVVVDDPKGYRYLMADEARAWGIGEDDLFKVALLNLAELCRNTQIQGNEGPDRMLLVSTNDGYAAARILLRPFQTLARNHLGSPFCFGIPNRDFLICWSAGGSREFQTVIAGQLGRDFAAQPYPLCPDALAMDEEGRVVKAKGL